MTLIHSDNPACQASPLRLSLHMGVVRSRWASLSSKLVAGRVAGRGGFDSHPLSPIIRHARNGNPRLHQYASIDVDDIDGSPLAICVLVFKKQ
jgi:hypothetical protein